MKAREGDLIETLDGNIFDVKGLVHPLNKIIAFIRFTPDPKGERKRGNTRYRKVYPLHDRYELLKQKFPQYLVFDRVFNEWLCEVPVDMVKEHYEPHRFLSQLRRSQVNEELGKSALELTRLLKQHSLVNWSALGVSGSLLVGLNMPSSDIDVMIYGSKSCEKVHKTLQRLVSEKAGFVKSYGRQELKVLFDFRSKDTTMRFEDFVRTESRKVLQGKFHGRDYFIRCVREWDEVEETYGSVRYESAGEATVKATISDDSQMIFTPCVYPIKDVKMLNGKRAEPLREIASFRGRFCEQARNGERIVAHGKVERVQRPNDNEYYRLLLGNRPSDYMVLAR
jgi:predicted nucleotidyltransferase